jgi:ABC-2 type transport system permease protein
MHKIWIILKSEFLRRVRSKWFILLTLLAPVILIAMIVLPAVISVYASENDVRTVAVLDESGVLLPLVEREAGQQLDFEEVAGPPEEARQDVLEGQYDGLLVIPAGIFTGAEGAAYYSVDNSGMGLISQLEGLLDSAVEEHQIAAQNVSPEVLDIIRRSVPVQTFRLTPEGASASNSGFYFAFGFFTGMIMYFAMLIYGAQVMSGVMEEKASRVVEVVVSSVRPFQLLMGKILGIGAVGLVQMAAWGALVAVGIMLAGTIAAQFLNPADFNLPEGASQEALLQAADFTLPVLPPTLFIWFILFFLGGYLLYASLYAAVGSAVEQQQDAHGLSMPITMLVIIPVLFIGFVIDNPNSSLSLTLSLIPFFAPTLMIVRIVVADIPAWQPLLAFVLLLAAFIGAVWVSSRIYRVGILMYGKKPGFKDLARWVRYA